jgi:hypothetical protein
MLLTRIFFILFKKINFLAIFFYNKNFYLINSPLQYINLVEYLNKNKFAKKYPLIVGYSNVSSVQQIKLLNLDYFKYEKIFYLKDVLDAKIFHIILSLKKFIFGFDNCVIGDFNYYLFKEFYKYSKKNTILDDGTSTFEIIRKKFKKKTIFFSFFEYLKNNNLIFVRNNFNFLKSKIQKLRFDSKIIYIVGSASVERKILTKSIFSKIINLILAKNNDKIIYYVPHRLETDLSVVKNFKRIKIKKFNLPLEVALIREEKIPKKIISFYSTCLFTLNKIYGSKIKYYNFSYNLKNISDRKIRLRHLIIHKEFKKQGIKNFIYKNII